VRPVTAETRASTVRTPAAQTETLADRIAAQRKDTAFVTPVRKAMERTRRALERLAE
jgi:hypothetical protein